MSKKYLKKNKLVLLLGLAIISVAIICSIIVSVILNNNSDDYITNGEAAKMLAALENDFESLDVSRYEEKLDGYVAMAVTCGIMNECEAQEALNNKNLKKILEYYDVDEQIFDELKLKLKSKNRKVTNENFLFIYDYIINNVRQGKVTEQNITIVATPGTVEGVTEWTAHTTDGKFTFYGLLMDGYLDNVVNVYVRNKEIVGIKGIVTKDVVYHNVWIHNGNGNVINTYVEGLNREFYPDGVTEELNQVMADICLSNGVITAVQTKTDTIKGKVLSVTNEYVEIEGYGKVPFDPEYKLYRNYGGFAQISHQELLVGYELQDFIVGDGVICGAIIMYPFEVKDIRIMIRDTGFESIYHSEVEVSCNGPYQVMTGDDLSEVVTLDAGAKFVLDKKSELLKKGRIRIVPVNTGDRIIINSIERSQGKPAYPGFIEIASDKEGIYIVNEVNLEQYLKLVVPSEMPASYGVEALKVQAVCARSYAYNQLLNNDYSEYGAHIDDSTWYQVYNNTKEYAASNQAVDETCGQVMTVDGQVITAYYYSTSCGHGSNISIWGQPADSCSYITAHTINPDSKVLDLTSNEVFYNFITDKNEADFDSTFPLYRWKGTITLEQINELYGKDANVGTITSIDVIERCAGGTVNKVVITGTKGTYMVEGELNARKFFGDTSIELTNNNGKKVSMASLPSGFFALNPIYEKKKLAGYEIIGGGYGHGLGMSQNGAYGMTKLNYTYDEILKFYYNGVAITTMY